MGTEERWQQLRERGQAIRLKTDADHRRYTEHRRISQPVLDPTERQKRRNAQTANARASLKRTYAARRKSLDAAAVIVELPESGKGRRDAIRAAMPLCKKCDSAQIVRAGVDKGVQRYRCKDCGVSFAGAPLKLHLVRCGQLLCFRCGGVNCQGKGYNYQRGTRIGYCLDCRQYFRQGGRPDLQQYHLCLLERCKQAADGNDELATALFGLAAEDVLDGKGYCWNVELRIKDARKEMYADKEYRSHPRGSDHIAICGEYRAI